MIRLLKDCFDKKGNRYKVISFVGDRYQCQSYATGKCSYFTVNEITASPPRVAERVKFTEIVRRKEEQANQASLTEVVSPPVPETLEPVYEEPVYEEPVYDFGIDESEKIVISKDNVKETAEDFYADL